MSSTYPAPARRSGGDRHRWRARSWARFRPTRRPSRCSACCRTTDSRRRADRGRPSPVLNRHVESFLEMQSAERGAARNTLLAYAADLESFRAFAAEAGVLPEAADCRAAGTLRQVAARERSRRARRRGDCRRCGAFFKFLAREEIRTDDPSLLLDTPADPPGAAEVPVAGGGGGAARRRRPARRSGTRRWRCCIPPGCGYPSCWGSGRAGASGGDRHADRARQGRKGPDGAALAARPWRRRRRWWGRGRSCSPGAIPAGP